MKIALIASMLVGLVLLAGLSAGTALQAEVAGLFAVLPK